MGNINTTIKNNHDGLFYEIMLVFGYPENGLYRDISQFKRKPLKDISDEIDERLEPARLAPSSVNSQPWYFVHDNDILHVFCQKRGLIKGIFLHNMNLIDIGIALAHLYVSNTNTFEFIKKDVSNKKRYKYVGSIKI